MFAKNVLGDALLLDPHTATELSIDETIHLCDDLIAAHGNWPPKLSG